MEPILEEYMQNFGQKYGPEMQETFLNCHASVCTIEILGEEPWYWFELKTPGYPPKNFVGTYCLNGGNWINKQDKNPLDVYRREISEEVKDARIVSQLLVNAKAAGDYFSHVPKEVHGNPRQNDYNFVFSLVETNIDRYELAYKLGLENDFSAESLSRALGGVQQYPAAIVTLQQFKDGLERQICWGYDQIMSEYLERKHGFHPRIRMFEGIVVKKLESSPFTPFEERETLNHYRINPLREATDDKKLFSVPS